MKIVFDTNVLLAAFISQGLCHALFEQCLSDHHLFISAEILHELEDKLSKKLHLSKAKKHEIDEVFRERAQLLVPKDIDPSVCRDPKDLHVLGLAVAAEADALVTGDQDLLILKRYEHIPILSPREFYTFLQKNHAR